MKEQEYGSLDGQDVWTDEVDIATYKLYWYFPKSWYLVWLSLLKLWSKHLLSIKRPLLDRPKFKWTPGDLSIRSFTYTMNCQKKAYEYMFYKYKK